MSPTGFGSSLKGALQKASLSNLVVCRPALAVWQGSFSMNPAIHFEPRQRRGVQGPELFASLGGRNREDERHDTNRLQAIPGREPIMRTESVYCLKAAAGRSRHQSLKWSARTAIGAWSSNGRRGKLLRNLPALDVRFRRSAGVLAVRLRAGQRQTGGDARRVERGTLEKFELVLRVMSKGHLRFDIRQIPWQ